MSKDSWIGCFAVHHSQAIAFISAALCLAGIYAAFKLPSSVFPQTNFPRVVILVDNGVMPADEMMATITRPIEEAMKDIPGAVAVRSATGRGSAEINVFFNWQVNMIQSELYVDSRLSQIRSTLPTTASTTVWRLTFSAFPIIGVSLISPQRSITELWETARYELKPRFLRELPQDVGLHADEVAVHVGWTHLEADRPVILDRRNPLRERHVEPRQDELTLHLGVDRRLQQRDLQQVMRREDLARHAHFLGHQARGRNAAALAVAAVLHLDRRLVNELAAHGNRAGKAGNAAAAFLGGAGRDVGGLAAIHLRARREQSFSQVAHFDTSPSAA